MIAPVNSVEQNQFKKIITDIFQEKFYTGILHGSILSVLVEIMEFAQGIIKDLEDDGKSSDVACHKSCCYCCYSHLEVIPVEALLIASFIETHFESTERSDLKGKINQNRLLVHNKTIEERFELKQKTPCVFLKGNTCSIYPVRPFICRAWNSLDKIQCEAAFYADTYDAEIDTSPVRNFVFGLARTMIVELSKQVNLQSNRLEMSQAISKCIDTNDSMALWLAGYRIFDAELDVEKVDGSITEFHQANELEGLNKESGYVNYFYGKYQGRLSLGVGYDQSLSEIFPFVFQDAYGRPLGVVAMGVITSEKNVVHIYHIGVFMAQQGDGSLILAELCRKADCFNIRLSARPVSLQNGKDPQMDNDLLSRWYNRFDFRGESNLMRVPRIQVPGI